jgi:hypothetical protein
MIVWGGEGRLLVDMATFNRPDLGVTEAWIHLDSGGRYDPRADRWRPMSHDGAPLARSDHSAVWTGSEMIVWGGMVTAQYLTEAQADDPEIRLPRTGGRYDPARDTWRPTSVDGAPTGRCEHHAIWTGREMIIFGGYSNAGGRYDPTTDTWTALPVTGHAPLYDPQSVVWTGDTLLVWGGREEVWDDSLKSYRIDGYSSTRGLRYSLAEDQWHPMAPAPRRRSGHKTVWTGTEMLLLGGVLLPDDASINDASVPDGGGDAYDPRLDRWRSIAPGAPLERGWWQALWTGRDVLIWGGKVAVVGVAYDPHGDTWRQLNSDGAPSDRTSFSTVWTGDALIVWGGMFTPPGKGPQALLDSGGRYRP